LFFIYERVVERIGSEEGIKVFLLAGIGAFNIPFLYFLLSWYIIQKEEKKPIELFFAMFLWGMVSAFISFVVSSYFSIELYQINMIAYTIISVIILTPIIEETIKGIGVFLISGNKEYNDTLTGLLLGFSVGLGFAFIENWFYFSLKTNPFEMGLGNWTMFIFYRSFFNSLAHGCFTGFISAMIGYAKSLTKLSKFAKIAFMPGLIVAIAVHMVFNITAIIDNYLLPSEEYLFFIFNPMLIILLGAIFFMVLVFALVDEQKRKNEKVIK
jgi:RsiW-degrading membrane proteinase PrsW (M82 family)